MAVVHCKKVNFYDLYIGRPSILGNPFTIGKDGTRDEVIEKYETYARDRAAKDNVFRRAVINTKGKRLACWCAPQRCHGDIIEMLATEFIQEAPV